MSPTMQFSHWANVWGGWSVRCATTGYERAERTVEVV